jgi:uncharacterized protein YcgL (UPF0745 family)
MENKNVKWAIETQSFNLQILEEGEMNMKQNNHTQ